MGRPRETTAQRKQRRATSVRLRSRRSSPKPGANCRCLCRQCSFGYHCSECWPVRRAIKQGLRWAGIVNEVNGDLITAGVVPDGHEGPELIADFSMEQCGLAGIRPGDILDITPGRVTRRELGVWTQAEIDEIMRRARIRHKQLMGYVE